ncbi:MAG TPA: lytic murein transglycosylase B [Woeseiaceae bacterium]|jgi:membrane-bound lytic murein transglycosylase B|nr:lytic murein transglycosylase B [Woeseiaceae bacterium]
MKDTFKFITLLIFASSAVWSHDIHRPNIQAFIENMTTKHNYDKKELSNILLNSISQEKILSAISRPAEKMLTWNEYRNIFLKKERINAGAKFWKEHQITLNKISEQTGVNIEILVGIIGVETYFGRITGGYRVIDALTTLAFDYPKRSPFFTKELEAFLLLTKEEKMDPFDATGSYAGAMGSPQFMPSSYRAYAVDSDGDGKRDIWNNWSDVIGSIANYFIAHGWQKDNEVIVPVFESGIIAAEGITIKNGLKATETITSLKSKGISFDTNMKQNHPAELLHLEQKNSNDYWVAMHNFFVITKYNHSIMYGLAVHQLGQEIAIEFKKLDE